MSSSNTAAETVINIENGAISSEPSNEDTFVFSASFYFIWIFISLDLGIYHVLPILFPISLCSLLIAFYGICNQKNHLLIPFMLTVAWDTIYAIIYYVFVIILFVGGKEFFLNNALFLLLKRISSLDFANYCCAHKASFILSLIWFLIEIFLKIGIFFVTKQLYVELQKRYEKKIRRVYGEQIVESFRERGLVIVSNEQLHTAAVALSNERPIAELMAQIPPPPPYQSHSTLSTLQTPQNGTPPPTYSMLEREQLELDPLPASPQSINNIQLSDTITQTIL